MARRRSSLCAAFGSGTAPVIGTTSSGEVPQVTCGSMAAASSRISVS